MIQESDLELMPKAIDAWPFITELISWYWEADADGSFRECEILDGVMTLVLDNLIDLEDFE